MSEATQTQTLEQTLNKTDLGHLLYEHRKSFFAALITVILAVTGFYVWKGAQLSSAQTTAVKVFEFQDKVWNDVKAGKTAPTELVKSFEALDEKVQAAPIMLPLVLEMSKFLYDKGSLAEAAALLGLVAPHVKHPTGKFFIDMQYSVVLEKLGKVDESIATLEKLAQIKEGLMQARVSLELGRVYLLKGEKGKAQTQFEYIQNTFPNDPEAKLAKLYLANLSK